LGIPVERVRCPFPDTRLVPDSGPTVASRTAMVVGNTVFLAARQMKAELEMFAQAELLGDQPTELVDGDVVGTFSGQRIPFEEVAETRLAKNGLMRVENRFKLSEKIRWNQETFEGDAYPAYSWGCNVVEVSIDPLTLELSVPKITAVYDIGTVINPVLAKGQIEGGLIQALGYAMMEKIEIKDGHYDASRMQTYVIPTSMDIPRMDIEFVEYPYEDALPGAKGVGEIPMDGLAPALANAVEQAAGVRLKEIPITPEKLFEALR
ncbi:MAG: molybdopterin cofactor-binding domain-containing protein, partial [Verrucomicrobiota bacterium]